MIRVMRDRGRAAYVAAHAPDLAELVAVAKHETGLALAKPQHLDDRRRRSASDQGRFDGRRRSDRGCHLDVIWMSSAMYHHRCNIEDVTLVWRRGRRWECG